MNLTLIDLCLSIALCAALTALQVAGHSVARREAERSPERAARGLGAVEGAVFGLLALLLGFSFSSALSRFESRKELIVAESVLIGSTWQWLDTVNSPAREELRAKFLEYTDTRIQIYRALHDEPKFEQLKKTADRLQAEIWAGAVAANKAQGSSSATTALLSSLNETFDTATKRFAAQRWHAPMVIFVLLVAMSLGCAFLAGYSLAGAQRRHWIAILSFSFLMALTVYVILDLEFPRMGLIRVDDFDALLVETRAAMR
jgi:hypothetical protein